MKAATGNLKPNFTTTMLIDASDRYYRHTCLIPVNSPSFRTKPVKGMILYLDT